MNCTVLKQDGTTEPGKFLGLIYGEESGEALAVVRFSHGMMLSTYHPSRVTLEVQP